MASCLCSSAGRDKRGCPVSVVKNNLNREPRPSQKGKGAQTTRAAGLLPPLPNTNREVDLHPERGRKEALLVLRGTITAG